MSAVQYLCAHCRCDEALSTLFKTAFSQQDRDRDGLLSMKVRHGTGSFQAALLSDLFFSLFLCKAFLDVLKIYLTSLGAGLK